MLHNMPWAAMITEELELWAAPLAAAAEAATASALPLTGMENLKCF